MKISMAMSKFASEFLAEYETRLEFDRCFAGLGMNFDSFKEWLAKRV